MATPSTGCLYSLLFFYYYYFSLFDYFNFFREINGL